MFDRAVVSSTKIETEPEAGEVYRTIHPILHLAMSDKTVPHEVKRLLLDIQGSDPVEAASDARILLRLFGEAERDPDTPAMRDKAFRMAQHAWKTELPPQLANIAATKLVQILEEWADAELDAVL